MIRGRRWIRGKRRPEPPVPITGGEARAIADELVLSLGVRATCYADWQALQAHRNGDGSHFAAWRWIARITQEILRSEPGPDGRGMAAG